MASRQKEQKNLLARLSLAGTNAVSVCIIAYCVISLFAGQAGFLAYRDLSAGITQMNERLGQMLQENVKLKNLKSELLAGSQNIESAARRLGYIKPGERIVVIAGKTGMENTHALLEPLFAGVSTGLPDNLIKLLAVLTGSAIFLVSIFL